MPFKLKLKKSRQYTVSSKNLFVLSVELLDNTTVECTLSSQSTGQECLHNVCQRLGLQQPQYFGLRFLSKKGTFWWVDLQRPLKKQLDKYALESCNLYLGVMFFVSDVNILHDEVTRYHYFLQLKSDILEGKLHCNEDQTILFASYSLQAEFGDHDPERHTTEYLTNFGLLPKQIAQGKENQEAILERVILNHRSLQGLSQQLSEVYYIMEAQRLDGYGLECFGAKDNAGSAIIVGVSLNGIYIWHLSSHPSTYFPWDQILNLVHHKRCFGIEYRNNTKVLQTFMEDSHVAKYVWKTCIQQHRFYTKNEGLVSSSSAEQPEDQRQANFSPTVLNSTRSAPAKIETRAKSLSQLQESQESLDGLGVYHTDGAYSELVSPSTSFGKILHENKPNLILPPASNALHSLNKSTPCVSTIQNTLQPAYSHPVPLNNPSLASSNASQIHNLSSSDVSVHHSQTNINEMPGAIDNKPICSVLPTYRQAPDYDTAVKLKYGIQSSSTSNLVPSSHQLQPQNAVSPESQIDLSRIYTEQQQQQQINIPAQSYSQYKHYADLSHLDISELARNVATDANVLIRSQENVSVPTSHPPVHTYSSPDLASQATVGDFCNDRIMSAHMLYQFKPPPPYPYKQRSSSSTPDLTRNHQALLPNSNPDGLLPRPLGSGFESKSQTENSRPTFQVASSHPVQLRQPIHSKENYISKPYTPASVGCAKLVTSNIITHQTVASSHKVGIQNSLPIHTYQNYNPTPMQATIVDSTVNHMSEPQCTISQGMEAVPLQHVNDGAVSYAQSSEVLPRKVSFTQADDTHSMGPMLVAAMNGLSLSRPEVLCPPEQEKRCPNDVRIQALEARLAEGQVFLEFERILKKKPNADFSTAILPENMSRNRFKDVFPYEENRVRLTPTNENKTGYINASHLNASVGNTQRFYIAAQGPLPNTLYSFWQMMWEHHVSVIVMLTEVQEQGRDKCFPYWPQEDGNKLQIGEFQIIRNFSMSSPTYVTSSLSLCHIVSHQQRPVWHIQYTDWPDHSCPQDVQGFIAFMGEVDAVRRHAINNQPQGRPVASPIVVHCSAGVGRSGAVVLCDIMLYALDHNQPVDIPKTLTHLRLQRMLTVQTLAQYKFVYTVLIQYLRNSRLI